MKGCWPEGDLRAYQDGELLTEEMERIAAHLTECPNCEALTDELAGRAARVSKLMAALPDAREAMWIPRPAPARAAAWPRWPVAGAALAAGLGFLVWVGPWRSEPVPAPAPKANVTSTAPRVVEEIPEENPKELVQPVAPLPRTQRVAPVRAGAKVRPEAPRRVPDVFLALDDEPIETGVVMRVALGEAEIPAEVVFGKDGRARAIRLVSNFSNR
jgi:hypothetical protein